MAGVPGRPEPLVLAGRRDEDIAAAAGQDEWSSRGALSMRSISPLVAWR
jgi:hypothetical protein